MEESYKWVKAAILTSNNQFHIDGCKNLVKFFADIYAGEEMFAGRYIELTNELDNRITFLKIDV